MKKFCGVKWPGAHMACFCPMTTEGSDGKDATLLKAVVQRQVRPYPTGALAMTRRPNRRHARCHAGHPCLQSIPLNSDGNKLKAVGIEGGNQEMNK
jgi:hypothetical protein